MPSSDALQGRTVLILGFARQGQALARWLPSVGARCLVVDDKPAAALGVDEAAFPGVTWALGATPDAALLNGVDLVCVSGGVPLEHPLVAAARTRRVPLSNDAQLFLERCPAPVVGITGSAGKTTTTALTGAMLRAAGRTTHVGGNIGRVLLDDLSSIQPEDVVVMELSSFQLELMTRSPQVAALLNITPNHLNRHGTMEAYTAAKANIFQHQRPDNVALFSYDDAASRDLADAAPGQVALFSRYSMVADGAFQVGGRIVVSGLCSPADGAAHVVAARDDVPLRGDHNVANVLAACALAGLMGTPPTAMQAALVAFTGVPHRLETVRVRNDVRYVNDSIATAPERALAAVRSYDAPLVLLWGGADKKLPWDALVREALPRVRHIVLFGTSAADAAEHVLRSVGVPPGLVTRVASLEEAVARAQAVAEPGDVVLLSPGGTSYDAYTDFEARGAHFRALVDAL